MGRRSSGCRAPTRPPAAHYVTHVSQFITFLVAILCVLVFLIVWLLNQLGADRLQRRIDEL